MDQTATSTSASATKVLDPDAARTFTFPNGTLNKHQPPQQHHHRRPASPEVLQFRECLKNHAASLGGHALDGCGEFMPSPATNPADPTSLRCAACGCHRNFHRRLPVPLPPFNPRHHRESHLDAGNRREEQEGDDVDDDEDKEEAEEDEDGEEIDNGRYRTHPRPRRRSNSPAHVAYSSAPHMLLALSSGLSHASGPNLVRPVASTPLAQQPAASAAGPPRKRLRTKFSPEQKKRMQELSEKLGWRMQKRDETMVEEWCREIGVSRGVFKVWMHNNKHHYLGSARRAGAELGSSGGLGCGIQRAPSGDDIAGGINCNMVNGSSSSS